MKLFLPVIKESCQQDVAACIKWPPLLFDTNYAKDKTGCLQRNADAAEDVGRLRCCEEEESDEESDRWS